MNTKDNIDFYFKTIPALSSSGWKYTDNLLYHDVMAWHILRLSDPDVGIRGQIGIQNIGGSIRYLIQLDNGEGGYPAFLEIAPIPLEEFESYTNPSFQPIFAELEGKALSLAYQMIAEKRAGWIERRKEYLREIDTLFNFGLKGC